MSNGGGMLGEISADVPRITRRAFSGFWFRVPDELDILTRLRRSELKCLLTVLWTLQRQPHREGRISIREVASIAGLSTSNAETALAGLCQQRMLVAAKAAGRSTVYSMPIPWRSSSHGRKIAQPGANNPVEQSPFLGYWFKVPEELEFLFELSPAQLKCFLALEHAIQKDRHAGEISLRQIVSRSHTSLTHVQAAVSALCEAEIFVRTKPRGAAAMIYRSTRQWQLPRETSATIAADEAAPRTATGPQGISELSARSLRKPVDETCPGSPDPSLSPDDVPSSPHLPRPERAESSAGPTEIQQTIDFRFVPEANSGSAAYAERISHFFRVRGFRQPRGPLPVTELNQSLTEAGMGLAAFADFLQAYGARLVAAPQSWKHILVSLRNWIAECQSEAEEPIVPEPSEDRVVSAAADQDRPVDCRPLPTFESGTAGIFSGPLSRSVPELPYANLQQLAGTAEGFSSSIVLPAEDMDPCESCISQFAAEIDAWLALSREELEKRGLELRPVTEEELGQPYHPFSIFREDNLFAFVKDTEVSDKLAGDVIRDRRGRLPRRGRT